jgi:hypothetical protein
MIVNFGRLCLNDLKKAHKNDIICTKLYFGVKEGVK